MQGRVQGEGVRVRQDEGARVPPRLAVPSHPDGTLPPGFSFWKIIESVPFFISEDNRITSTFSRISFYQGVWVPPR